MVVESANQNSNRQICAKREKCRKHDGLPDCIITTEYTQKYKQLQMQIMENLILKQAEKIKKKRSCL